MRKLLTHFSEILTPRSIAAGFAVLMAVVTIPSAVLAWGPDRPTFTQQNPAGYVTFNSITDNPKYGDERNFMRIRDVAANQTFGDEATLVAGKEYEVKIFYHNNASASLNAGGQGIAKGAYARAEMPALVRSGNTDTKAMAYVGATNATPASVYDHITLKNTTGGDIAPRYVAGSAKIVSNGPVNGKAIPDALFTTSGTSLGYDTLNGQLPGCDQYSGYITYRFVAAQANFDFAKDVRIAGSKTWADRITAKPGDKVEYRLGYKNTGTTEQKNVVFKDVLPKGMTYVAGQTDLQNGSNLNGKRIGDGISGAGVNIGNYMPGANAYLYFFATVNGSACEVLTNTAAVETNNGNKQDSATVVVAGDNCVMPTALPTTGPAEVAAATLGLLAITIGVVYYLKSRQELNAVIHMHTHK